MSLVYDDIYDTLIEEYLDQDISSISRNISNTLMTINEAITNREYSYELHYGDKKYP